MKDDKGESKVLHEYDGIKELDNQLPRWWLASFYITIIFAVFYFAYYMLGDGTTIDEEFAADMNKIELAKLSQKSTEVFPNQTALENALKNPDSSKKGYAVYASKCLSCHGDKGQGLIGPNLTDKYWIHGDGSAPEISKTIHNGVPDKGMPPWGALLKPDEIYEVVAYIKSIANSNPQGAKAPQGTLYK